MEEETHEDYIESLRCVKCPIIQMYQPIYNCYSCKYRERIDYDDDGVFCKYKKEG